MTLGKNLNLLQEPYIHFLIANETSKSSFVQQIEERKKNNIIIKEIDGKKCSNVEGLFDEFAIKLQFPTYFGENWAAFDECINDLEWLDGDGYILVISNFDELLTNSSQDLKVFKDILLSTIQEWVNGREYDSYPTPPTPFHVVLHCLPLKESIIKDRFSDVGLENIQITRV
ncbi:barstar family protein [Aquisalibacillus elongatus]|uniref:Barstar (Barnase inhibitor) n=1 Tax=Aquisalibacillus elongatus TaxID=485577 RepID=A0A3N5CBE8_9BACI|nr:barstar family protein [Aquisalibacillus elongatus]RPF54151.1 barstar (barnase inhibitor) [Aquisalibacillus elongatus]